MSKKTTEDTEDTEEPAYLATLTTFAFKRGQPPHVEPFDFQKKIDAMNSPSVAWVGSVNGRSFDEAQNEAIRQFKAGHGMITAGGQMKGCEFPTRKQISPRPAAKAPHTSTSSQSGGTAPGTLSKIEHREHDMTLAVKAPPGALAVDENDADALMGAQLTAQWELVKSGTKHQLILGAMMLKIRERLATGSACGVSKGSHDPTKKGTGLKGWIGKHAPKVSESSAYRMMEVAEGLRDDLKLGKEIDLEELLAMQVEDLPEKLAAKREAIDKVIDGKSQRQLLLEFGKVMKRKGGARSKGDGSDDAPEKPAGWSEEQWERYIKLAPEAREAVDVIRPTLDRLHDLGDPEHSVLPVLPHAERKELDSALRKITALLASVKKA